MPAWSGRDRDMNAAKGTMRYRQKNMATPSADMASQVGL
jgi:hypothetical protein